MAKRAVGKRTCMALASALVGLSLWCPTALADDISTMYRLYNPWSGEHLYTSSAGERDSLAGIGWVSEGVGWFAPATSGSPVYRLYNPYSGDHHYTLSKSEYDTLGGLGWSREGTGWYSDDNKGVPLYRVFNPYAVVGTHHYTTSQEEYGALGKVGWVQEGVAWYGTSQDGVNKKTDAIIADIASGARKQSSTADKLTYVAEHVGAYAKSGDFVMSGDHYRDPAGLLVYGQSSCAAAAATCAEVLTRMGYAPKQINKGRDVHNWVEVTIDGTTWVVEGEAGFVARKSDTSNYPNGVVTTTKGETFEFRASS